LAAKQRNSAPRTAKAERRNHLASATPCDDETPIAERFTLHRGSVSQEKHSINQDWLEKVLKQNKQTRNANFRQRLLPLKTEMG